MSEYSANTMSILMRECARKAEQAAKDLGNPSTINKDPFVRLFNVLAEELDYASDRFKDLADAK